MFKFTRKQPYSPEAIHTYIADILALEDSDEEENHNNAKIMRAILKHMLKKNERSMK